MAAGAVGAVLSLAGSSQANTAAARAARATERSAQSQQQQAEDRRQQNIDFAQSPEEFAQLEQAGEFQERQLKRQERLIESLDPAILEAATQAGQLLKGEEAASLGPARAERSRQRQNLLNQLREQLGPGAETSSVGQQALQKFDQETSTGLAGLQQQSLSQLFSIGSHESGRGNTALQGSLAVAGGFGDRAQRSIAASQGSEQSLVQTGQRAVDFAGSRFVGAQLAGSSLASVGKGISSLGGKK